MYSKINVDTQKLNLLQIIKLKIKYETRKEVEMDSIFNL